MNNKLGCLKNTRKIHKTKNVKNYNVTCRGLPNMRIPNIKNGKSIYNLFIGYEKWLILLSIIGTIHKFNK